jgi:hypothetical protein
MLQENKCPLAALWIRVVMPDIGEEIEVAIQQAPQKDRHAIEKS